MANSIYWTRNKNKYGFPIIVYVPKPKKLTAISFGQKKMEHFTRSLDSNIH
jgi:hypothetical protein